MALNPYGKSWEKALDRKALGRSFIFCYIPPQTTLENLVGFLLENFPHLSQGEIRMLCLLHARDKKLAVWRQEYMAMVDYICHAHMS